jgi:hypothetical protein
VGTPFNRLFFQLQVSTLPTEETEFGLWLGTPTAGGDEGTGRSAKFRGKNKAPTPKEFAIQVSKMLPTPKAQESRGNASRDRGKKNLTDEIAARYRPTSNTSQLNPRFVGEMMGFPENWTELPFLSGEENQSKHTETQ